MTSRIQWLDIVKGIGIFFVISGHCLPLPSLPFHLIFSFHMPLFFLASGYLHKSGLNFLTFFRKKFQALIVPFLGFVLLGLIVTLLIPSWRSQFSLDAMLDGLSKAYPSAVNVSSIWFLVCLFIVSIIFYTINDCLHLPLWFQLLILTGSYLFGFWIPMTIGRLYLTIDVAFVAVFFYALGYYLRKSGILEHSDFSIFELCTGFLIGFLITWFSYRGNGYVNMHALSFGNPVLYLTGGLGGSLCVYCAARLISEFGCKCALRKILLWYGRHTLLILGFQSLLVRLYIIVVQILIGQTLTLYFFPWNHAFLSTVVILLLCIPLCMFWERFSAVFRSKAAVLFRRADITK